MDKSVLVKNEANLEAYRQAFETLRHYGNLRFTMLTAFVVISGALFTTALQAKQLTIRFVFPSIAGIVIAIVFGLNEWRINTILDFYAKKIVALGKDLEMTPEAYKRPKQTAFWKWITPVMVLVIYAGSIVMWIAAWITLLASG
jgi:hypothetical protein